MVAEDLKTGCRETPWRLFMPVIEDFDPGLVVFEPTDGNYGKLTAESRLMYARVHYGVNHARNICWPTY